MDFFRFSNRYILTGSLVMKTPLSVGSRVSLKPAGSDLPVIKTPDGLPFIPGSSLKGIIRAHIEQLLRTLQTTNRQLRRNGQTVSLWACDPLSDRERCVITSCCEHCGDCQNHNSGPYCCDDCFRCKACMTKRHQRNGQLDDAAFTRELFEHSCTACRLFGSSGIASRVHFQDALLTNGEDLPRLVEVRDGVAIDRDLGSAKHRLKYDFEVVPAGAAFGFCSVVENAEEWEVGLLLLALLAMEHGLLQVGGKTSRGLGWGELRELQVTRISEADLLCYLQGHQPTQLDAQALIATFTESLTCGGMKDV